MIPLRCLRVLRASTSLTKRANYYSSFSSTVAIREAKEIKLKQYKTEDNFIFLEDPDNFGTLSGPVTSEKLDDDDDIKEEEFLSNSPFSSQQLTTKQYADLIKQYLKHKRLKEAIDILENRMIKQDRVQPENYIYNILIGACADMGYTKKAFKLFNDMKRRALQPTGDTYTLLFHACANSPWTQDGLKRAHHLWDLMIEKGVEPNLTNYNSMIKAFGRCGDLVTAFKIVDEMVSKKIKIRVHTFNHLLHACISDKENGLRHALIVWRKMLKVKEKPNIYSFNLILKCVKDCNLGSAEDMSELIGVIEQHIAMNNANENKALVIKSSQGKLDSNHSNTLYIDNGQNIENPKNETTITCSENLNTSTEQEHPISKSISNQLLEKENTITMQLVEKSKLKKIERTVPNLLSKNIIMEQVLGLKAVNTAQEKFAIIGGQEDFLKEMEAYSVKPDVKIFTQMLPLIDNNIDAEDKLLEAIKTSEVYVDIDFYNMLIKKRCLRSDYDNAREIKDIIKKESKRRKRKYPLKKKLELKENIMTYGVLAMACPTKDDAVKLLDEMKESQIKVNSEILGTLLRQGTAQCKFGYILYIMNVVKELNIQVNDIFLKHLEKFNEKCSNIIKQGSSDMFVKSYHNFAKVYSDWLKNINVDEALQKEHPWEQFDKKYPETVQRSISIEEPKKFYKRNRKFVKYKP